MGIRIPLVRLMIIERWVGLGGDVLTKEVGLAK